MAEVFKDEENEFIVTLEHCERLLKFILELDQFLTSKFAQMIHRKPDPNS